MRFFNGAGFFAGPISKQNLHVYRRVKDPENSIKILIKANNNCPIKLKAATSNNLGLSYFDNKLFIEANEAFDRAIKCEEE